MLDERITIPCSINFVFNSIFGVIMNKVFILFFCLCSCLIQASNKEFLEQAIMDSDLARVQSALSTTYLTEQDKLGLIDLANDIIIKRIKKWNGTNSHLIQVPRNLRLSVCARSAHSVFYSVSSYVLSIMK
jgi:hypothetical protein